MYPHLSLTSAPPSSSRIKAKKMVGAFIAYIFLSCLSVTFMGLAACTSPTVESFHFVVLGDRTGGKKEGELANIIQEINRLHPDFVVNVGDMIEGYTADVDSLQAQWEEYLAIVEELDAPLFPTPGNHDISPRPTEATSIMEDLYKQKIRQPDYTFHYKNAYFIVISNGIYEKAEDVPLEKLDWLEEKLRNKPGSATHIFVSMHRPYWLQQVAQGKPSAFHTLFKKYKVTAVFTGHNHYYATGEYDSVRYIMVGSSGAKIRKWSRGAFMEYLDGWKNFQQFLWASITEKGFDFAPIKTQTILSKDLLSIPTMNRLHQFCAQGIMLYPISAPHGEKIHVPLYEVDIKNNSDIPIMMEAAWECPNNWYCIGAGFSNTFEPFEWHQIRARFQQQDALFPLPALKMRLTNTESPSQKHHFKRPIQISRIVQCPRIDTITVDGIKERKWYAANPVEDFCDEEGNPANTDVTRFYFLRSNSTLYVFVEATEPNMNALQVSTNQRDDAVYKDDCIGFFFTPEPAKGITYQLYINTAPHIFDAKHTMNTLTHEYKEPDESWDSQTQVTVKKHARGFTMELAVDLETLGLYPTDELRDWRFMIRRKQMTKNQVADLQPGVGFDFNEYGYLTFQ